MSYVVPAASSVRRRTAPGAGPARAVAMLVVFLVIGAATGALGLVASSGAAAGWYPRPPRVTWAPPATVIAVARSGIILLLAVAEWLVWRQRRAGRARSALAVFVPMQVLTAVWPIVFYAGYGVLGLTDLWLAAALLLLLDLLVVATAVAFWTVSRAAGAIVALHLVSCLVSTALALGSAGMHAVL